MGSWTRRRPRSPTPSTSTATRSRRASTRPASVVNEKTGGKHADKIDQATGKARDALDSLDGKNDDIPPGTTR